MKNIITILMILLVGISSCNKTKQIVPTENAQSFEQQKENFLEKIETDASTSSTWKQTNDFPKVGDTIIIRRTNDTETFWGYSYVSKVWESAGAFAFIATIPNGNKTITVLANKDQITVNTQTCSLYPANSFITYKAALNYDLTWSTADHEGIYNWHENQGCAPATMMTPTNDDVPKIVVFHQKNDWVLTMTW